MNKRKLVSIQTIKKVRPIPNADNIEVVTINGWKVVAQKGQFQKGDLCVYFEIDSFLPEIDEFEFLRATSFKNDQILGPGFRLKSIKFRDQISQGLVLPINVLNRYQNSIYIVGQDVTELLGVKKYELLDAELSADDNKALFPYFLQKTDENRIQNELDSLDKLKDGNYYITEKLDGTSGTFYINNNYFGVCTRSLEILPKKTSMPKKILQFLKIKKTPKSRINKYTGIAMKLNIENKLKTLNRNIAIQGELIGPGIQKNIYNLKERMVKFFSAYDIDKQEYLVYQDFIDLMNVLELDTVPVLETPQYTDIDTIENILTYADGKSLLNKKVNREGVVVRSTTANDKGDILSFKVVSNKYLLKQKD